MYTLTSILLNSIVRVEKLNEEYIEKCFLDNVTDLNSYINIYEYITDLLNRCLPKEEIDDSCLFEEEEDIKNINDWDFDYMEYMWYSLLKRTDDFYSITPRNFFKQMDIWKDINNIKDKEENVTYL